MVGTTTGGTSPTAKNAVNNSNNRVVNTNNLEDNMLELLPNQLYFTCYDAETVFEEIPKKNFCYISIHGKFHYEPFYEDFGPWNLSVLYRLCVQLDKLLEVEERRGRLVVLYCYDEGTGEFEKIRVNTAYVLAAYLIIYHGFSADDAYLAIKPAGGQKYIGFRDASMGDPSYLLHIHDVLRGVEKALRNNWLNFLNFDYKDYEFYERVENGDLNWIIPKKILSFCGPHSVSQIVDGYPYHSPETYFDYFREKKVSTIVRLNTKNYDANKFIRAGFDHVDLFFVDGSTPSDEIMMKFLRLVDNAKGAVAIHCKAGLGRTGTLIACWMMKEFGLTAPECIAWLRICRPGSVIGPQQNYLLLKQKLCWSLSKSNGVHLPRSISAIPTTPSKDDKKNVKRLTSRVDDITIGGEVRQSPSTSTQVVEPRPRPNILPIRSRHVDETAVDEKGRSQGDRLLQLKAKHQHEKQNVVTTPTTPTRYSKYKEPIIVVPSQAYLNKNREPITPTRSKEISSTSPRNLRSTTNPNGATSHRTRNSSGTGGLTRTPASAVFPSMATRRSEATRYSSPTTPIKPMSPANHHQLPIATRYPRRAMENVPGTSTSPQFGLIRLPDHSPHLVSPIRPLAPHNYSTRYSIGQQQQQQTKQQQYGSLRSTRSFVSRPN